MSKAIMLLGVAGAGKDTTATILQDLLGFEVRKFAAPLKRATAVVFGPDFDDRDKKEVPVEVSCTRSAMACINLLTELGLDPVRKIPIFGEHTNSHRTRMISPREWQQKVGTEFIRAIDPDIWYKNATRGEDPVIISDCRFLNEFGDEDNKLVFIFRGGLMMPEPKHVSEKVATDLHNLCRQFYLRERVAPNFLTYEGRTFDVLDNNGGKNDLFRECVSWAKANFGG